MEDDEALVVGGLADNGPADKAGVRAGDRILAVNGTEVPDLAGLWRAVWASGNCRGLRPIQPRPRHPQRLRHHRLAGPLEHPQRPFAPLAAGHGFKAA